MRHLNIRAVIFAAIAALLIALMSVGGLLLRKIEELGIAGTDNLQWTVSQLEIEVGRLNNALLTKDAMGAPAPDRIRLRFDIMLSRLALLESGNAAILFAQDPRSEALFAQASTQIDRIDDILKQTDAVVLDNLAKLQKIVSDLQPNIRDLSLVGVTLTANAQTQRRTEISQTLTLTGGIAVSLIIALTILLIVMDRLYGQSRRRDKKLQQATNFLSSTVSASLDAIVVSDTEGRVIGYNASAEEILGWSEDEILGQKMSDTIIPIQHRAAHKTGMRRYLETEVPRVVDGGRVELTALRKSGEEFPIEINITSVDDEGEARFIAYMRDISLQKDSEQKLISAKEQAEAADKAKSRFLAVMSHEMRTPLNGVLGVLDLLKDTKVTTAQRRYVEIATASSEILLQLVNEALDITRIETGTTQLDERPFRLRTLVTMVVETLDPLAREKDLDLSLHYAPNIDKTFLGDANRIRQIVTNLVGNAIKFTDAGNIEVVVHGNLLPDRAALRIDVVDTGRGINSENLVKVFEDFVSVGAGAGRQTRNDGLGLSISKRIAQLMGGDLTVKSTPGVGSTFTLAMSLPEMSEVSEPATGETDRSGATKKLAGQSVLIVEDNDINRSVLKDILGRLGIDGQEARNGQEAVNLSETTKFDVILMDVSMPIMNGLEATRRIRAGAGTNAKTKIFGLTAHGQEDLKDAAADAGMTDIYSKPIRMPMLVDLLSGKTSHQKTATHNERRTLDPEIWVDLTDALGARKAMASAKALLHDVETFTSDVRGLFDAHAWQQLGTRSHTLQGGAALLGFEALSYSLKSLSESSQSEDRALIAAGLADLSQIFEETQALVFDELDSSD